MKKICLSILLLLATAASMRAQVGDRYPYIQQPTETSVLIAWNTANQGTGTVEWGMSASALTNSLSDVAATQKHALTITGLQPNTQYFYKVTTDAGFSSAVEHFWTAKPVAERQVSFLHYGDCGYNNGIQNQLAGLMEQEDVDFAVVAGDVDQGVGNAYDNVFFGVYKNMLARDCHYTAIGNHDIIANNGVDFFDAFYQPTNNPQQSEHYYSFTWGNAKFICLDSNGDYSIGSDQHDFLLEELKCREQEWVFVFFHHPPWTNAWDPTYYVPFQPYYQYDGEDAMRTALVPYFEQYKVDFVLNGHSHCYQRGSMNGVEYVISGGAGASSLDGATCNTFPSFNACAPNIQKELYINEFVRFRINGDAATYVCIDPSGTVVDSVTVTKTWLPYTSVVTTNPSSANDGSASISVTGGNGPFTYLWSNGETSSTITNLAPATYTVVVTDAFGCMHTDSAVVDFAIGLTNPALADEISVFPNPTKNNCTIFFPNSIHNSNTLELRDIQGKRVIFVEGISSNSIDLDTQKLPNGIYLLRISSRQKSYTKKLIVQR